jgi:MFS family permease
MSDFTISSFIALSGLVGLAVGVATGVIAGYIGRKRLILIVMSFLQLIFIYPFFILLRVGTIAGNFALVFGMVTLMQAIRSSGQAVVPAVLTEQFGAKYRVTGSGLAYQLSTFLAGGVLLSFLISPLEKAYGEIGVMPYVAVTWIILCTLGVILPGLFTRDQAQLPA